MKTMTALVQAVVKSILCLLENPTLSTKKLVQLPGPTRRLVHPARRLVPSFPTTKGQPDKQGHWYNIGTTMFFSYPHA